MKTLNSASELFLDHNGLGIYLMVGFLLVITILIISLVILNKNKNRPSNSKMSNGTGKVVKATHQQPVIKQQVVKPTQTRFSGGRPERLL